MTNAYDILLERGFVEQVSDEARLRQLLGETRVTCYVGYDPTASSLHVGNLLSIMMLGHLQRAGHRPIVLLGGGTAMIGDPSGKTEMRQMLTREQIVANGRRIQQQFSRVLDFSAGGALLIDNADWLLELNYITFLREIGRHFSVNRMLAAEAYKIRLETGLSFLEFNYQLLQAYDFLMLYRRHGCRLQMGGNDQWGNILAGVELIRRVENQEAFALTAPLLTTASGQKMGKTAAGAVWLDAELMPPYDFYQYWINVDDRDVVRLLQLYTFLPLGEINRFRTLQGAELREAKALLAFEVTKLIHGEEAARQARDAARALFAEGGDGTGAPQVVMKSAIFKEGIGIVDLFHAAGLAHSKSEARRLIQQGGAYVNRRRIESIEERVGLSDFEKGELLLRAGKKRYQRVVIETE
ncbi:MAG: tyrosine--tRNA ligase [candidate division KSB1 bacterium]|nr:tyrosine--tRNA ligase [candidate division KSB1 bacterium]MDZ7274534.1 tyrosine--tRNA ligase [candidate division KSB1 bacterium]MDZ7284805.1 tyrosine--tRNA ligase [candidate division KSB1 bacterium]MDZ7297775.1 tyrosine--tRNA ligase [candidate division KSB1 bacterium]MDZ7306436.1 tyrosine--tRNA ligase [candidate division KSB1 bacterium]